MGLSHQVEVEWYNIKEVIIEVTEMSGKKKRNEKCYDEECSEARMLQDKQ
jgi:hypothetical protein